MKSEDSKKAFLALFDKELPDSMQMDITDIVENLKRADSGCDIAACIAERFNEIALSYGEAFLNTVKATLSTEIWANHGVLFNPEVFTDTGHEVYHVLADGSVKTVQDNGLTAFYYGDVDLRVKDGVATVYDSKNIVSVERYGAVKASGRTRVTGSDFNYIDLYDQATATVEGNGLIWANDDSFVESKGGYTRIYASGQAQLVVNGGSARLFMSGSARGVVLAHGDESHPIQVNFMSEGALYIPDQEASHVRFLSLNDSGVLLRHPFAGTSQEEMMRLIVPRFYQVEPTSIKQILEPLPTDYLRASLTPYLPDWKDVHDRTCYERAADELDLCQALVNYLPEMVQKGVTGEFLGTHFTEQTLCKNGIYLRDYREPGETYVYDYKTLYYFGDQTVNTEAHSATVYGFDNTLIIVNNDYPIVKIGGNATAIAQDRAKVHAYDHASVFATGESQIEAHDKSFVRLSNLASVVATDETHIQAFGYSSVKGLGEAKVELYGNSKGLFSERCQALAGGENVVEVSGQAHIAYPAYADGPESTITQRSKEVTLVRLNSPEAVVKYRDSMSTEKKGRQNGMSR